MTKDSSLATYKVDPLLKRLDAPEHIQAKALYEYWCSKSKDGKPPKRTDIHLDELAALRCADRCFIIEPSHSGDWQYRLLGTTIARYYDRDVTGIPFSQHMPEHLAESANCFSNEVAETLKPLFLLIDYKRHDYSGIIETMSLPIMARDGETVWLFGGSFFKSA